MKKLLAILAAAAMTVAVVVFAQPKAAAETVDRNYLTRSYHVDVTLTEDNVYHVTERIEVDFLEQSHGIYRYIPTKGAMSYRELDGKLVEKRTRTKVRNFRVKGESWDTDHENGNFVARIGDEHFLLSGPHSYVLSYELDAGRDLPQTFDLIYLNLIPQGWRTSIDKASFTLTLPQSIPAEQFELFTGSVGAVSTDGFDWSVEGQTVHGVSREPLRAFEGVTLRAQAPEGYFTGAPDYGRLAVLLYVLLAALPLLCLVLYWRFGRDPEIVPVAATRPPAGMTSADVGYILDSAADQRDLLSLLLEWANKGCLSIEELGDTVLLTRLQELPAAAEEYERTLFGGLFEAGDQVESSSLAGEFYQKFALARQQLAAKYKRPENRLHTRASQVCQAVAVLCGTAALALAFLIQGWLDVISDGALLLGCGMLVAYLIASFFGCYTVQHWYVMRRSERIGAVIGVAAGMLVPLGALLCISLVQMETPIPMAAGAAGALLCAVCASFMDQRTGQCSEWLAQLLGLREFIELSQREGAEQFGGEVPPGFYDILPYAYAMGLADIWCRGFEETAVEPPDWYVGGYHGNLFTTMVFFHSFSRSMNRVGRDLTIPPADSSGSSGGSGSFGGGGGGFSGGGFGGGGGGSW